MRYRAKLFSVFSLVLAAAVQARADDPATQAVDDPTAQPESETTPFLRLVRDDDDELVSMETAIVRYHHPETDVYVDLVGVVHIGEKAYYDELNEVLADYDVVLYELVAPEGTRVPTGGKSSGHPVAFMQQAMKNMLELESQLACIDYQAEHFVHADMSPEEFADSMAQRGESFWTLFFRMLRQSVIQQSQGRGNSTDIDFIRALFDPNRSLVLKRVMAEQFEDLEGAMSAFNGPDGSAIITDRNTAALEVFDEQIDDGKKRLAIFYGAGHMPDMHARLLADYGFEPEETRWLVAWDLTDPRAVKKDESDDEDNEDAAGDDRRPRKSIIRFDRPSDEAPAEDAPAAVQ